MNSNFIVRTFTWVNGKIQSNNIVFDQEQDAISYARSKGLAEMSKVYQGTELVFVKTESVELYA